MTATGHSIHAVQAALAASLDGWFPACRAIRCWYVYCFWLGAASRKLT